MKTKKKRAEGSIGVAAWADGKPIKPATDNKPIPLRIPIREIEPDQGLTLGFRMEMLTMGDVGGVTTGSGCGNDFITLKWGNRSAVVRGSELLKAWVETFAPEDAVKFPKDIKSVK